MTARLGWLRISTLLLGLIGPARAALAQDSVVVIHPDAVDEPTEGALPPELVQQLINAYNDSTTTRLASSFTLPAGARMEGRIAMYRGTLRVLGRIDGPVTVINGDLVIGPGGVVRGSVLVVGGRIYVRDGGRLDGDQKTHAALAAVYRMPNGLLAPRQRRRPLGELAAAHTEFQTGALNTRLTLETGKTYNRVEGLPIIFGPTFRSEGGPGLDVELDVRGIFRPATDRTKLRDNIGFRITTEWQIGTDRRWLRIGGRASREIVPIEQQPLTRGESGWSAFMLQRDYRDHFETRGAEGYLTVEPVPRLQLSYGLRSDLERSVPASDPVSVFRNRDTWRPNPLVDDGRYLTHRLGLRYDSRNDPADPTNGWLVTATYEDSRTDDASPVSLPTAIRPPILPGRYHFAKLAFDIRRYARFDPKSRVNARLVGAGGVDGDPLPIQRRVSLGGPDILPGFGFRSQNCAPPGYVDPTQAALCDRSLAFQLEVRRNLPLPLPLRLRNADLAMLQQLLGIQQADLVLLGNVGKAWLTGEGPGRVPNNRIPRFNEWDADIGIGIDAGGLAVYLAKPLAVDDKFRFILRLERRF